MPSAPIAIAPKPSLSIVRRHSAVASRVVFEMRLVSAAELSLDWLFSVSRVTGDGTWTNWGNRCSRSLVAATHTGNPYADAFAHSGEDRDHRMLLTRLAVPLADREAKLEINNAARSRADRRCLSISNAWRVRDRAFPIVGLVTGIHGVEGATALH